MPKRNDNRSVEAALIRSSFNLFVHHAFKECSRRATRPSDLCRPHVSWHFPAN